MGGYQALPMRKRVMISVPSDQVDVRDFYVISDAYDQPVFECDASEIGSIHKLQSTCEGMEMTPMNAFFNGGVEVTYKSGQKEVIQEGVSFRQETRATAKNRLVKVKNIETKAALAHPHNSKEFGENNIVCPCISLRRLFFFVHNETIV